MIPSSTKMYPSTYVGDSMAVFDIVALQHIEDIYLYIYLDDASYIELDYFNNLEIIK